MHMRTIKPLQCVKGDWQNSEATISLPFIYRYISVIRWYQDLIHLQMGIADRQ
jgi:hypothetical protein